MSYNFTISMLSDEPTRPRRSHGQGIVDLRKLVPQLSRRKKLLEPAQGGNLLFLRRDRYRQRSRQGTGRKVPHPLRSHLPCQRASLFCRCSRKAESRLSSQILPVRTESSPRVPEKRASNGRSRAITGILSDPASLFFPKRKHTGSGHAAGPWSGR